MLLKEFELIKIVICTTVCSIIWTLDFLENYSPISKTLLDTLVVIKGKTHFLNSDSSSLIQMMGAIVREVLTLMTGSMFRTENSPTSYVIIFKMA